jgi:hypothetical protein
VYFKTDELPQTGARSRCWRADSCFLRTLWSPNITAERELSKEARNETA